MTRKIINKLRYKVFGGVISEGRLGIKILGRRLYAGGMWDYIGKLQFNYLVSQGLKPTDCFLDVACGSLRGGIHFIKYLNKGNYLGIDKEEDLVKTGVEKELGKQTFEEKKPEFVFSDKFEFYKFSKKPQLSLALSLFAHLNSKDIELCLRNLREFVDKGHIFFSTFFEGDSKKNRTKSHSLDHFEYSRDEMISFGEKYGWESLYIGNWNHPRDQMMMKYIAR